MLPNRSTDADNPRLISDGKGLKEDRKGGRRERKVELGEERRWEKHRDTRTQRVNRNQKGNQFNQIQHRFASYISLFYRVRGLRKERIKIEGVAPLGKEEVMDGYRNPSGCLHAFSYSR